MNAKEAQKMSARVKNIKTSENIEKLMEIVYKKISESASKGDYAIGDPFDGLRLYLTPDQRRAVKERLVVEGYTIFGSGEQIERISWATN